MRRQNTQNKRSWIKWTLLIVVILLISVCAYMFYLYNEIQKDKMAKFEETEKYILANTEIVSIDTINEFYEQASYHIVFGETEDKTKKVIFFPLSNKTDDLITVEQSSIIPKDEIVQVLMNECKNCTILKVEPAIINDNPLWELTYRDQHERYILDYLSMYDGSRYERLQLKQMFK